MTTPAESQRAVERAGEFLGLVLLNHWPRMPVDAREVARSILRHFPSQVEIARLYLALDQQTNEVKEPK